MANLTDNLFGGDNASLMSMAFALMQPTHTGSFSEAFSNAGLLAVQTQRQEEERKKTDKLYRLKLDELERKTKESDEERIALQGIMEASQTNPEISLGELYLQAARRVPSMLDDALKIQNQEIKLKIEEEKTQQQQLLSQQLIGMTDDPMAQLLFQSGQINPGIQALNRNQGMQQRQQADLMKQQENENLALSLLPQIQNERQDPIVDNIEEIENFRKQIEQAYLANPQSAELRRAYLSARKQEATQFDQQTRDRGLKLEREITSTKTIPPVTPKELDEIERFYASQDKKFGSRNALDLDQKALLNDVTANRVKELTTNGLNKNLAVKHATDWGRFNLLMGRDVNTLINLPVPTAKEIQDLEKTDPVVKDSFSEKQTYFFSKYGYLPGITEFTSRAETKLNITTSDISPADLKSYNNIKASGNIEAIAKAQEIFYKKYGRVAP